VRSRGSDVLLLNVKRTYNSTYGVRSAKTNGRTVDWVVENQLWKTVCFIMSCKRATMRNWTARSARNYSCKLGVCTRSKQARSRNFRNLMEIKLRFYIQLWPVNLIFCRLISNYRLLLFLQLSFVFVSAIFFSLSRERGGSLYVLRYW